MDGSKLTFLPSSLALYLSYLPGVRALFDDGAEDEEVDDVLSLLPLLRLGSQVVALSAFILHLLGGLCYFHFRSRPFNLTFYRKEWNVSSFTIYCEDMKSKLAARVLATTAA